MTVEDALYHFFVLVQVLADYRQENQELKQENRWMKERLGMTTWHAYDPVDGNTAEGEAGASEGKGADRDGQGNAGNGNA